MLTCREVSDRANQYLDGELGFWPAMQVRMHLMACRYCRRFMQQTRTVIRLVEKYGYTLPEDEFDGHAASAFRHDDLMERFRRRRPEPPG